MIPRALRELVQASRRTARELRQTLEEVAELLRESHLEGQQQHQQAQPARVRVRESNNQHPLARHAANNRRHFSTVRPVLAKNNYNNLFNYVKPLKRNPSISTLRSALNGGIGMRSGLGFGFGFSRPSVGRGMFSCFPKQSGRMFSTFPTNVTHQIVENMSQNIRMFFLKGGKLSTEMMRAESGTVKSLMSTEEDAADLQLASKFSDVKLDSGCVIDFDFSDKAEYGFECGVFDEHSLEYFEEVVTVNRRYQDLVLKDIKTFKEEIGSTSFKYSRSKNRLRFYCPNCDLMKMEMLLREKGVSTGVVRVNNDIEETYFCSPSTPDLVSSTSMSSISSDYSEIDSDILSTTDSIGMLHYYSDSGSVSILSS